MDAPDNNPTSQAREFIDQGRMNRTSFVSDFLYLLKNNKKWWMLPLLAMLLIFGAMMILASSGAAPFIYTLF